MATVIIESTNLIKVSNVKSTAKDGTITDVSEAGEFTIYDSAGVEVAGQSWPTALTLVSAGEYAGFIESDCELVASYHYDVKITIGTDVEKKHTWTSPVVAKKDVR